MAGLDYRCLGCAGAIFPNLTKTGKVSNHPRKYCSDGCKPVLVRIRTPHKPKLVVCQHCFCEKYRRVRGGTKDAGKYCSRGCAFARDAVVSRERGAIKRIWSRNRLGTQPKKRTAQQVLVSSEVAALRRIASYREVPMTYLATCGTCDCSFLVRRPSRMSRRRSVCDECIRANGVRYRMAYKLSEIGRQAKRTAKAKRRAVERGADAEAIDPFEIFERDRWCCHICRRSTPARLRGTYDMRAPELDHIVTLAEGGTHTRGNLSCACRGCNLAKGRRSFGQIGLGLAA